MSKNSNRGAHLIVINENGDAMQRPSHDDEQHQICSNRSLAYILEEAGILTDELARHLGQVRF